MEIKKFAFQSFDVLTLEEASIPPPNHDSINHNADEISHEPHAEQVPEGNNIVNIEEMLEQARNTAFEEGYLKAQSEFAKHELESEKQNVDMLANINLQLALIYDNIDKALAEQSRDLIKICLEIIQKLTAKFFSHELENKMIRQIQDVLSTLKKEPVLELSINPENSEFISDKITSIKHELQSLVSIKLDDHIPKYDFRLSWNTGIVTRSRETLWRKIFEAFEREIVNSDIEK